MRKRALFLSLLTSKKSHAPAILILLISITLAVLSLILLQNWIHNRDQEKFIINAKDTLRILEASIDKDLEVVHSIQSFFSASDRVSRQDFHNFVSLALMRHPEIQALEWMVRVAQNQRTQFERSFRLEGFSHFQITEFDESQNIVVAPERLEYFVVTYVEPMEGNQPALGYNVSMNPIARNALDQALRKEVGVSQWLKLAQSDIGFVVYIPIPKHKQKTSRPMLSSPHEFAVGVFRLSRLIESAFANTKTSEIDFEIKEYDETGKVSQQFRYDAPQKRLIDESAVQSALSRSYKLHWQSTLNVGTRSWPIHFFPSVTYRSALPPMIPEFISFAIILIGSLSALILASFRQALAISQVNIKLKQEIAEHERTEAARLELISRERNAREKAEQAAKAREEFLNIASHELRTPLTPLKMQIYVLKKLLQAKAKDVPETVEITKALEASDIQLDYLKRLIDDLLDVSRIVSGRLTLFRSHFNLSDLIKEITEKYKTELAKSGCTLNLMIPDNVPVYWDKLRIEQVITNLITNAFKFAPKQPIDISINTSDQTVRIAVEDRGIGIESKDQARIFDRFERAVSTRKFGGLGLGLFISRQIVNSHGGTIRVESKLGKGATFILEIPAKSDLGA